MMKHPKWGIGSGAFVVCIVLAGIIVNLTMRTPNTVGGGDGMMFAIIILAVVLKVAFQFSISRWQKRREEKSKRDDNRLA